MDDQTLKMPYRGPQKPTADSQLTREWLVTNGLGGYASGTVFGVGTRRYHGLLVAALPAPLGRQMMLNYLSELLRLPDGSTIRFGGEERVGSLELHGIDYLTEFRLEMGLPVWRYEFGGFTLEKRLVLPHGQNTVHVQYKLVQGSGRIRLKLRPSLHFRSHDAPVSKRNFGPYQLTALEQQIEVVDPGSLPPLRMFLHGERSAFTLESKLVEEVLYRVEADRGYEARGSLWSPGYFRVDLTEEQPGTLVASTEPWPTILALPPQEAFEAERERRARLIAAAHPAAHRGPASQWVLAADQFVISPAGRVEDAARARAAGDEVRTVIAGYHWFTDWGRDTMISLEGLTLTTGRHSEAGYILRTFGHYVRDGLIPNLFPEGGREGLYHTADATLWFFHAIDRYLAVTGDRLLLQTLLPTLREIVERHVAGTRFGIMVDPDDGLLQQGQAGYQLTWMDAKVGDWVVTPRRGKAVEINALWYNALRLLENWVGDQVGAAAARPYREHAERAREAFNRRFWIPSGGYLFDIVDGEQGNDAACRPNQVFAISLSHAVLDEARRKPVLDVVTERLLTPLGLRTLAPGHPDYKPQYYGDLRARDAAYHQGTVWAWLIGPYIDARLKLHPEDRAGARQLLSGFVAHLSEAGVGTISEVFDAERPFTPRACIAQAWSVAEVLRCWVKTAEPEVGKAL